MTGEGLSPDKHDMDRERREALIVRQWHGIAVVAGEVPVEDHPNAVRTIWRQFYVLAPNIIDARDILSLKVPELFVETVPEEVVMHSSKPDHELQARLTLEYSDKDCVEVPYAPPHGDDLIIFY